MAETRMGNIYRDVITGFKGTATAKATYITGCNQTLLTPLMKEDAAEYPAGSWMDDGRLVECGINQNVFSAFVQGADLNTDRPQPTGPMNPPPIK